VEANKGNRFRQLDQISYPAILKLTEEQSEDALLGYFLLPRVPPQVTRSCRSCGGPMRLVKWADGRKRLECDSEEDCENSGVAISAHCPMYDSNMTYKDYFMMAALFAMQFRVDQAMWLSDLKEYQMLRCFAAHRDVCAWYIIRQGRDRKFKHGEVDIDVAKHVVSQAFL
jgi:ssDNA-binding Zn-finger/Zn-ribbon topoisomerase 1